MNEQKEENIVKNTKVKNHTIAPRVLYGVVVSDKMKDTASVRVTRYVKHGLYGKYVKKNKKYMAHDVGNISKVGDKVGIRECRPISKTKRFRVIDNK
jgi:small subunit ribosomal protein S17